MSDKPAEASPWDDIRTAAEDATAKPEHLDLNDDYPNPDADESVVDVHATEPAKKKSKILFVMVAVAFVALGIVGYIGYSLFQKLSPPAANQAMGGAPLLSQANRAQQDPALPPPAASSLPIGNGSSEADKLADANLAQQAQQLTPVNAQPVDVAANNLSNTAMANAAPVQPVATPPAVVPPVTAAPRTPPAPPAPPTPAVAQPEKQAPPVEPVACVPPPKKVAKKVPAQRSVVATASESSSESSSPKTKSRASARKDKSESKTTQAAATSAVTEEKPSADRGATTLDGYKIIAIEPRYGDHQQAWVQDPRGRTRIVSAGEMIDGIRVVSVSFAESVVKTSLGTLRK